MPAHGTVATYEGIGRLPFRGLLPDTKLLADRKDQDRWSFAEEWRDRVQAFEGRIEHLGPHRSAIARVYEAGTPRPLSYNGSGAPGRLARPNGGVVSGAPGRLAVVAEPERQGLRVHTQPWRYYGEPG